MVDHNIAMHGPDPTPAAQHVDLDAAMTSGGMSVLVVDDEPLARRRLIRMLGKLPWVTRIDEAGNVTEARARIAQDRPDILILDVQMPDGSGFAVLPNMADAPPAVVFVTAFDHHAVRAFDADAIDYVTKPVEAGRFEVAMQRARAAVAAVAQSDHIVELQEAVAALKRALGDKTLRAQDFWVRSRGEHLRIPTDRVVRFQADRDYVRLHTDQADYLYQESLTSLERRLDPADFVRIHRSTIVRRDAIERIKPAPFAALVAVLSDGSEVRVGRTYVAVMRNQIAKR